MCNAQLTRFDEFSVFCFVRCELSWGFILRTRFVENDHSTATRAHENYYFLKLFNTKYLQSLSRYSDWLRAGQACDRIPVGGEIFHTCPDRHWGPPSLLYNGYRVFPGGKEWPVRDAAPHPVLVPWSRKSTAIPLLPLCAVRSVQSLCACTKVHFTFFCYPEACSVKYSSS